MNKLKLNTASLASTSSSSTSDFEHILTPTTTVATNFMELPNKRVLCDPSTPAGQNIGALLAVKRTPTLGNYDESPKVGDLLVILKSNNHYCDVLNIRSEVHQIISWEIFFPLTMGEKCCCPGGNCRCVVEDPDRFYVG